MENLQKDVLTIGITGPFERKHVPFIVKQFKENDTISIDIKAFNLFTCIEKLNNREIDIAFGLSNNFKNYPDLIYRTIYHSHICVVTSLEHPLSHKEYVTIKDIKNEPLIVLSRKQGKEYYHDYMEAFRLDGMIPYIKKEVDDLNEYVNDHIIYKIVVSHNDTSYLDKVAEVIKKETDADAIRSGKKVLAVKARGVSKAEAIKKLAQKLGIWIKDIIAFGDEVNDIEMLTLVGLGIAMENADDVVKEAADQIAGRNDQDGVGKELEKIFGNAGK